MIILAFIPAFGQELSLHIPVEPNTRNDVGQQVVALDDGFLVVGTTFCHEPTSYDVCFILLRLDGQGNKLWSKIFDGSPDTNLDMNGWTLVLHEDTVYVVCEVWKTDHKEIRLMSFDLDGNLLNQQDLAIPYTSQLWARGLVLHEDRLLLYGEVGDNGNRVFIEVLDFQFNILEEHFIGDPSLDKRFMELNILQDGGYVLAYGEGIILPQVAVVITKLDEGFNEIFSKKILQGREPLTSVNIYETEDKGFMLAWHEDLSFSLSDTFPFPTTIYKLDSMANVEWEYMFAHRSAKQHSRILKTADGKLFGIGNTDYYGSNGYPTWESAGWCFLIDIQGNLLWERSIADIRDSEWARFWYGLETDNGFVLVGDIAQTNPTGVPFLLDGEVWFLTLDKNGCWNGNCNEYIVITGDTTSITDTKEAKAATGEMVAYPNPTDGVLMIECKSYNVHAQRTAGVFDINGRKVMDINLYAPKSTINLSHLGNGVYFVTHIIDGKPAGTQKIIVHH